MTSHNVVAEFDPAPTAEGTPAKPRRTLIIGGHVDSAWYWRFNAWGHRAPTFFGGSALISFIWSAVAMFPLWHLPSSLVLPVQLCLSPGLFGFWFFLDMSVVVPGANDNLSGLYSAAAVGRMVSEGSIVLHNTRLVILGAGSEEAGLRGSKAFVVEHAHDGTLSGEVAFVALETLRDRPHLAVMHGDLHNFVKCCPKLCEQLHRAAADAAVPVGSGSIWFGASDACAFAQAGISSACFAGMDPAPATYYHTPADTPDNMSVETIPPTRLTT
jgi:aminopeptidase YwaD